MAFDHLPAIRWSLAFTGDPATTTSTKTKDGYSIEVEMSRGGEWVVVVACYRAGKCSERVTIPFGHAVSLFRASSNSLQGIHMVLAAVHLVLSEKEKKAVRFFADRTRKGREKFGQKRKGK